MRLLFPQFDELPLDIMKMIGNIRPHIGRQRFSLATSRSKTSCLGNSTCLLLRM